MTKNSVTIYLFDCNIASRGSQRAGCNFEAAPCDHRSLAVMASEQSIPHTSECLQQLRQCNKVLSPTDRHRLHELLAATADVLASDSHRRLSEAKSAAKSQRRAKRQRAAAAAKNDAGARLGVLRHLKGDTAAKCLSHLRADDFRNLASIKCCRDEGSTRVLRAGVKLACEAIAPYSDPPQLLLGTRGYEPLAVLEDSRRRAQSFTSYNLYDENWRRLTRSSSPESYGNYTLTLDEYCASNSAACNPRPRCERYATVAAVVIEIIRLAPNEFSSRTRYNWFAEWIESFVADDALRVDSDTSPSHLELLDGAGFATMIMDVIQSTEATQATLDRLSYGFEAAIRRGDKSTFASEPARLKRWRDAGVAVLKIRLLTIRGADTLDDDNVETIFSYISSLVWFLMGLKGMDLDLDEVWGVILDADREAGLLSYSLGFITRDKDEDSMLHTAALLVLNILSQLVGFSPPIAARLIALGAMKTCERVRNGEIRTFPRIKDTINDLYAELWSATQAGEGH